MNCTTWETQKGGETSEFFSGCYREASFFLRDRKEAKPSKPKFSHHFLMSFLWKGSLLRMRILESDCLGLDPSSTTSWLLDLQQLAYNAQCLSSIICKMGMTTISILHGNYEDRIRWFMPIEMQTESRLVDTVGEGECRAN